MKCLLALALCCALVLVACGKKPASSAAPSESAVTASGAASSTSQGESASSKTAAVSSSTPATLATTQQTVTMRVSNEDKLALVALNLPDTWNYDGGTTFSKNERKTAEVAAIWKVADAANPLSDELVYGFGASDEMTYPDGLGHVHTLDKLVAGNICRTYLYKMWPDDSEKPWYPHYTFYVVDGYVVQIYFFSDTETDDDALFDEVLSSISIHFAS